MKDDISIFEYLLRNIVNIDFSSSISAALTINNTYKLSFVDYVIYIISLGPPPAFYSQFSEVACLVRSPDMSLTTAKVNTWMKMPILIQSKDFGL